MSTTTPRNTRKECAVPQVWYGQVRARPSMGEKEEEELSCCVCAPRAPWLAIYRKWWLFHHNTKKVVVRTVGYGTGSDPDEGRS